MLTACHVAAEVGLIDAFAPAVSDDDESESTSAEESNPIKPAKGIKSAKSDKSTKSTKTKSAKVKAGSNMGRKWSGGNPSSKTKKAKREEKATKTAEQLGEQSEKVSSSKEASRLAPRRGKQTAAAADTATIATARRGEKAKGALLLVVVPTEHGVRLYDSTLRSHDLSK